jgi:hypothetical protein
MPYLIFLSHPETPYLTFNVQACPIVACINPVATYGGLEKGWQMNCLAPNCLLNNQIEFPAIPLLLVDVGWTVSLMMLHLFTASV